MKAPHTNLFLRTAIGALLVGLNGAAMAQTQAVASQSASPNPQSETSPDTTEILVTAQRRAQNLQNVPISISVMSGQALKDGNIQNLLDFSARLPQVKLVTVNQTDFLNIRGVGSGNNSGFQQSVGAFVDDVYLERARAIRAGLFDIDRVEVLKGPQTLFFGNNAIAGALNITTKKPEGRFDYDASVLYEPTTAQATVAGGVTLPVSSTLSVRVAGRLSSSEGYVYNSLLRQTGPNAREAAGRLSIRWEPSDDFRSDLRLERSSSRVTNSTPYLLLNCPADPVYGAPVGQCAKLVALTGKTYGGLTDVAALPDTYANYDATTVAWTNAYKMGDISLHSVTSYFEHSFENLVQLVPSPVLGTSGGGPLPGSNFEWYHDFAQELRVESDSNGPFDFMLGGYYATNHLSAPYGAGFYFTAAGALAAPTYNATTPVAGAVYFNQDATTFSSFGSATIRPFEGFRINLGVRYSDVSKDAFRSAQFGTNTSLPSPFTIVPAPAAVQVILGKALGMNLANFTDPHRRDTAWQPSASLQYDFTRAIMGYVSYARGFKAGGFDGTTGGYIFGPESVDAYEVGFKSSLFDRALTFNMTAFYNSYDGVQETSKIFLPNGAVLNSVANAGTSVSKGIEILSVVRLSDRFSANADVTFLDSYYKSFPNGVCTILQQAANASCVQNMSGKRRAYSPVFSGNVGVTYTVPVSNLSLRFSPVAYFTTDFFESATADTLLMQSGSVKFDATIALGPDDRRWDIAIIGKNLTNRLTSSYRAGVSTAPGTVYASLDPTRSIAIQFTVRR